MLQCCLGVKKGEDRDDDQYRKITDEDSNLLNGPQFRLERRGNNEVELQVIPIASSSESLTSLSLPSARPLGSKYSSVDEFLNHRKSFHEDAINLWTNPDDVSHSVEEDDRALYTLLLEKESCKDPQRREQCEIAIQRIRGERETTLQKWKKILVDLGFDREADKLLAVHSMVHSGDPSNVEGGQASSLHHRLVEESDIFGQRSTQAIRYTAVLERLLDLDIADSFVTMAIQQYPKPL